MQTTPLNRWYVTPGEVLWFRASGIGDPHPVRILNPGPLGQCCVCLLDQHGRDLPGGWLAVNPFRELHQLAV